MKTARKAVLLAVIVALLSACGAKNSMESFVRDDVDLSFVNRIAVLPFENNSKDPYVAERVRDIAVTQILAGGLFDVIDKGIVDSALREEAVDMKKAPLDEALLQRLGQRLGVQAFLFGTVDHYDLVQREGTAYPELALTFRLVDINTATIFWQASATRSGDSFGKRIFGLNTDDTFAVSLKLVRDMLATLTAPPPATAAGNTMAGEAATVDNDRPAAAVASDAAGAAAVIETESVEDEAVIDAGGVESGIVIDAGTAEPPVVGDDGESAGSETVIDASPEPDIVIDAGAAGDLDAEEADKGADGGWTVE